MNPSIPTDQARQTAFQQTLLSARRTMLFSETLKLALDSFRTSRPDRYRCPLRHPSLAAKHRQRSSPQKRIVSARIANVNGIFQHRSVLRRGKSMSDEPLREKLNETCGAETRNAVHRVNRERCR